MTTDNLLIEASAGTGKTQQLGERLIALLHAGVRPSEIVALTFSRMAAGEIFERFVNLLAKRAKSSPEDADLLRSVLASQHLSQIGTLDSFLMKIVRAFPMELGLVGDLEILDEYEVSREMAKVSFSILRRTDPAVKRTFLEAFSFATNREDKRSYVDDYRKFIKTWHEKVAAHREKSAWGDPTAIWGKDPAPVHATERELAAAADALAVVLDGEVWQDFAAWVRAFRGSLPTKGLAKRLVKDIDPFAGDILSFRFSNKDYALTREQTICVRDALKCVFGYVLRKKLDLARGIYTVVSAYETEYDRQVRRTGRLVFDDVPRLLAKLPEETRLALEFRLDSRLRAWALDEFQDTSREQWGALANLIDEAKQSGGEKSLFVVGDRKQAIYGWRDGDVGIFTHERESGFYALGELKKTYRSGTPIVTAVNRVFAQGRIRDLFPDWDCPLHETARPDLDGFVRVATAPGIRSDDFVEPVALALKSVLGASADDPRRRGVSAAVLVRGNSFGELLAAKLRAAGIQGVVWEGEAHVLDTPALSGFLDLVQLADHPGDAVVYRHFKLTPLAAAIYPDGVPDATAVSREMAAAFTTRGLVRTLRELRLRLPSDPDVAWSRFTEERWTDLLRAAATFELSMSAGSRLSDFASFLESQKKRNVAEDGKIRVMTIHRSKGLGFDYVVLPLYESKSLAVNPKDPLVGDDWILPDPGAVVTQRVGGVLEAASRLRKDRAELEALCIYYVAMTRARQGMTIVRRPTAEERADSRGKGKKPPKKDGAIWFSDIVAAAEFDDLANPGFKFEKKKDSDDEESSGDVGDSKAGQMPIPPFVRRPRKTLARRLPSLSFASGVSAGSLFASAEGRAAARRHGDEQHAAMAKVEFSEALPRPAGFVALWRERAFEVCLDGEWTSGRFDRVTFFRDDAGELCAEIIDFKSSLEHPERYDGQLAAYRRAVTALTGIPSDRVAARLMPFPS